MSRIRRAGVEVTKSMSQRCFFKLPFPENEGLEGDVVLTKYENEYRHNQEYLQKDKPNKLDSTTITKPTSPTTTTNPRVTGIVTTPHLARWSRNLAALRLCGLFEMAQMQMGG